METEIGEPVEEIVFKKCYYTNMQIYICTVAGGEEVLEQNLNMIILSFGPRLENIYYLW